MEKNHNFSKIDRFNLVLGIFNLVAFIVSICISIWAVRTNKEIAQVSGVLDKGQLVLSFGGYHIDMPVKYDIYIGINSSESKSFNIRLPFGIHNHGNRTIENVKMLFTYPESEILKHNVSNIDYNFGKMFDDRIYFHELQEDKVLYQFNFINPDFETEPGDIISVFGDSNKIFKYIFYIVVKVSAKDIKAHETDFRLIFVESNSIDSLIDKVSLIKLSDPNDKNPFFAVLPESSENLSKTKNENICLSADFFNIFLCIFDKARKVTVLLSRDKHIIKEYQY